MASKIRPEDLDQIIADGVNYYELLGVQKSKSLTERDIRRSYRQKALIYHPDKNPSEDARLKFELISQALEVLITPDLKQLYDRKLELIALIKIKNDKLSQNLRDMKLNLQQNEQKYKEALLRKQNRERKINLLREEGKQRIKAKEKELNNQSHENYKKEYQLKYLSKPPVLKLKWKVKEGIPDMFANDVILKLMEIFGNISNIERLKHSETRYDYCHIEYRDFESFQRALKHDYSKTSDIWDLCGLRKLSSLLRSVDIVNENNDGQELYFEDYFDDVIAKLNQMASSTTVK